MNLYKPKDALRQTNHSLYVLSLNKQSEWLHLDLSGAVLTFVQVETFFALL